MKCKCGREAVFHRKYEGRHLCSFHFCESIEEKVKKTIGKYRMLSSGDRIAIAVSGGKDSMSLLYIMGKVLGKRRDIEIFAISIDEGIGNYRSESIEKAKELSKSLGIKHHVFSFKDEFGKTMDQKVRELKKSNPAIKEPCTYCGVARRSMLNKKARELGATKLCMGHNLDDETQGLILNYIRGDLLRASRMAPVTDASIKEKGGNLFVPRIKPLRFIPERESALFAILKEIPYLPQECPYKTGIREDAQEFINVLENKYSGIKFSIMESFDKVQPCLSKIVKYKESEIMKCKKCGEPASKEICKTCELWG